MTRPPLHLANPYVYEQETGQECATIYEAGNVKNRVKMDGENQNLLSLIQATIAIVVHRLLQCDCQ